MNIFGTLLLLTWLGGSGYLAFSGANLSPPAREVLSIKEDSLRPGRSSLLFFYTRTRSIRGGGIHSGK